MTTATPAAPSTNGHAAVDEQHAAALAELSTKADQVRYAAAVLPDAGTSEVRAWLALYGIDAPRSRTSTTLNELRRERDEPGPGPAADETPGDTGNAPVPVKRDTSGDTRSGTGRNTARNTRKRDARNTRRDARPVPSPRPVPQPEQAPERNTSTVPADVPAGAAGGVVGFYVVAVMTMLTSLDTSWRVFGWIGIADELERAALFTVTEAALLACGVAMRAAAVRGQRQGTARLLAWVLCGLHAFGAVAVFGPVAGALRAAFGPALGLVCLHIALGIELRHATAERSTLSRIVGEVRERFLSRLGLGNDERDALARTRDRAARRAARLAVASRVPFRTGRLRRALRSANVAHDPTMRGRMLDELATLRHADDLHKLPLTSPWQRPDVG